MHPPDQTAWTPNPARSVTLAGLFGNPRTKAAVAQLEALAKESSEPVTLYLEGSAGGLLSIFEQLGGGKRETPLIIVVSGIVKSAAAYLAVSGDYTYMDQHARMYFHGISCANYTKGMVLKSEDAMPLAIRLDRENRSLARKLSGPVLGRLLRRCREFPAAFDAEARLPGLVGAISRRLRSDESQALAQSAGEYAQNLAQFEKAGQQRLADFLLNNLDEYTRNGWEIDELAVAEITSDFYFFHEAAAAADAKDRLLDLNRAHGEAFLTAEERADYAALKINQPEQAEKLLVEKALPALEDLRRLALAVCSLLLIGEITLSASDSYWLGLIDELVESPAGRQPTGAVAPSSPAVATT